MKLCFLKKKKLFCNTLIQKVVLKLFYIIKYRKTFSLGFLLEYSIL
jgi:hypothetical protein